MTESPTNGSGWEGPHLTEGVCRALLNGLLPPTDREAVLAHVSGCPVCERLFRDRVIERENLRASTTLRFGPRGEPIFEKHHRRIGSGSAAGGMLGGAWSLVRTSLRRPAYRFGLGLVAGVVIILMLIWPHDRGRGDGALRWLPIAAEGSRIRSAEPSPENRELAAGLDAYAARDLPRAIELLQMARASGLSETARRIYLANALAWSGRYAEAASLLRTVRAQTLPDPWGAEARWTLYVALKKSGTYKKGVEDELISRVNNLFQGV